MATRSSSLPLILSEDVSTAINDTDSPVHIADGDNTSDAPRIPNLQITDRRHLERHCPLRACSSTSKMPGRGASIDDLPDELMLEIFSYVCTSEIINVLQEVCVRWKILARDAHLWRHKKYIVRDEPGTSETIATFSAMPQLRTVIIECFVSDWFFVRMSKFCPHLTTLQTDSEQYLDYTVAAILFDGCKNIETLTISDHSLRYNENFIGLLARLEHLRVLRLLECKEVGLEEMEIDLRILADSCPHLCDLELGTSIGIHYRIEAAEYFISSHKDVLHHLSIRWLSIERRSIAPLLPRVKMLRSLQLLNVLNVSVEEDTEAYSAVGQLHNLQQLRILYCDYELVATAMFANGGFPKLHQLWLGYIVEGEAIRAVVEHCPELEELKLCDSEGEDDDLLEPLHRLKKLKKLKIEDCKFLGGEAMSYIAKIPALHTLEFCNIEFDKLKPSVDCILEMSGLRRIYLKYSKCSAIPFHKFPGRLLNLRELEIDHCEGDQEVLDRVCAQMPYLRTVGSFGAIYTDEEDEAEEYFELGDKGLVLLDNNFEEDGEY